MVRKLLIFILNFKCINEFLLGTLGKLLGEKWKSMSDAEKKVFTSIFFYIIKQTLTSLLALQ